MATPLDPNDLVTLQELALSNMWEMTLSREDAFSTGLPPRSPTALHVGSVTPLRLRFFTSLHPLVSFTPVDQCT